MNASVRVLTYNVQFRSLGMEILAQQNPNPHMSVEERAAVIADRILASPQQYDVVCLQEVFSEDGRKILLKRLSEAYPHHIDRCDGEGFSFTAGAALGVAAVSATIPGAVILTVLAGALGVFELKDLDLEDAGLMLFSKLPFEMVKTTRALQDEAAGQDVHLPDSIPTVLFQKYDATAGHDGLAAKGVLYAKLIRDDGRPLHLLSSHTQADETDGVGDYFGTRRAQFEQAYGVLEKMVDVLDRAEVLFCGDLNIDGTWRDPAGYGSEYQQMFATPGTHFTDELIDGWAREQSPGDPGPGRTPLPATFDRGRTNQLQRLDYAVRGRGPVEGRLTLQHMAIAYEIATDPAAPTFYTSDHLPVRIDLHIDRPHCSVLTAEVLPVTIQTPDAKAEGLLIGGQMHWYRIEEKGGYRIDLTEGAPRVKLDVYTADNLSVPVQPFTTLDERHDPFDPGITRYALPSAPFFLRVSMPDRDREAFYKLDVHRFTGTNIGEAIPLLRGVPEVFHPKLNAQHSDDDLNTTQWTEFDSVWFTAAFDTAEDGSLPVTSTVTVQDPATSAFGILVLGREGMVGLERMGSADPGAEAVATATYVRPMTGYILVQRHDPTFQAAEFTVTLTSDVSYLYAQPTKPGSRAVALSQLFCRDETNGAFGNELGSDDIAVNLIVGGETRFHLENDDTLEFDDDSQRSMEMLDGVRYTGAATFELVEIDSTSGADRASVQIPQFADIVGTDAVTAGNSAGVEAKFTVIFEPAEDDDDDDDGIYDLTITISAEPPSIPR